MPTMEPKQQPPQKQISPNLVLANQVIPEPEQPSHPILRLQRMIGNKAIQRLLQTDSENLKPNLAKVQPTRANHAPENNHLMLQPQDNPESFQLREPRLEVPQRPPLVSSNTITHVLQGFATDSAALTPNHEAGLQFIAADLNANPLFGGFVSLVGNADRRGTPEHNQALGQRRADTVQARLRELVTDEATRNEIRAYSSGEPEEGPSGDVPEFRNVTITISRRSYNFNLIPPLSRPRPETPPTIDLRPRPQWLLNQPGSNVPEWVRLHLPATPPPASFLNRLSRYLTGRLGREEIARFAGELAGGLGFDEDEARRNLNEALVTAGEEGLKKLIQMIIEAIAGSPTPQPERPYGPALRDISRPTTFSITIYRW